MAVKVTNLFTGDEFFDSLGWMRSDARLLTTEEENTALVMAISGHTIANILKALDFSEPKSFWDYRQRHPDFAKSLELARIAGCEFLEDKILTLTNDFPDARLARVQLEALRSALEFRNRGKYGKQIELNLNQTVDIAGSLGRMQQRLDSTYRDVTPQITNDFNELW